MRLHALLPAVLMLCFTGCDSTPSPVAKRPAAKTETSSRAPAPAPFDRHGRLIFTKHARCRMDCRHISRSEIREVLDSGTINYAKSEPNAKPDPKYALEGVTHDHQHVRIVVAPSGDELIVITCIDLGVEWQCHCN